VSSANVRDVQLRALEGWRGLSALVVAIFHLLVGHTFFLHEWLRFLSPILEFFFIVSGFVMALGFSEKVRDASTFGAFIVRRLGRVWPLHLAMLGLFLLIPLGRFFLGSKQYFGPGISLEALPYHLFMLQTWWPEIGLEWNYPAWTLTGELFAYLLMAIILLMSKLERTRWILALVVISVVSVLYYNQMLEQQTYSTISVWRAVTGFFIGFLVFHFWRYYPLRNRTAAHVLEIGTVIAFIALLQWHPKGLPYFLSHVLFAIVVYAYASDLGIVSRLLFLSPFQWLGKRSFSIYMFHGVITFWIVIVVRAIEARGGIKLTRDVLTPDDQYMRIVWLSQQWMNDAFTLAYIAVVLVGASFIFRWVEDPSRIYFAKLASNMLPARPQRTSAAQTNAQREPAEAATGTAPASGA
jgi:peptidoglycan/LPS O-acetylase OafA/YrhL